MALMTVSRGVVVVGLSFGFFQMLTLGRSCAGVVLSSASAD